MMVSILGNAGLTGGEELVVPAEDRERFKRAFKEDKR